MPTSYFEFLVEDRSTEAFLEAVLPYMLPAHIGFSIHPHQGKYALLRKLPDRLKAYARWMPENHRIVVLVDRDDDDCRDLKARLEKVCADAGLRTRRSSGADWQVVTRIAIEELEAWYFGDWPAVCAAYRRLSPGIPGRARYRDPDAIRGGTWEALERLLTRSGHIRGRMPKVEVAGAVGKHMTPANNRSRSFQVLHQAIIKAAT